MGENADSQLGTGSGPSIEPIRSTWSSVDSIEMHVRHGGRRNGSAVVLVHGLIVSSRYMLPLARVLAVDHDVYLPDLPGFERSGHVEISDTKQLGEALARWIDVAGLSDVTLVANSYGCQTAVEAALVVPERIRRLVLIGATADSTARHPVHFVWRLARHWWREPLWFWLTALRDLTDCGIGRAYASIFHLVSHDILEGLQSIAKPVLVVRGEYDLVCPPAWAQRLAHAASGAEVVVIPGVAHTAQTRRPAQIANHLRQWEESVRPHSGETR